MRKANSPSGGEVALWICAVLSGFTGLIFAVTPGVAQQIAALVLLLMSALFIAAAIIVRHINLVRQELRSVVTAVMATSGWTWDGKKWIPPAADLGRAP